ncbi:M13-type metalloendopeptidase [Flavobacterium sp.]|uniref:M13 family metallopeptidase n=1 Tax=Flavobacterium sp. TaxID=239 RepID=UPI00261FDF8A|nr:M13-type metalloendopeptidase [Flavobacterium sp.]
MKKLTVPFLALAALVISCQKTETLHSGITKANMDTLVKPGDNFDAYVNGNWSRKTKIPADKSSYGAFDMLLDKSEKDVKEIIQAAAKSNSSNGSEEQKIGDLYASFMDRKGRDAKGLQPIQSEWAKIDALTNYEQLAAFLGDANREGLRAPFGVFVNTDYTDPTKNVIMSWQSGLGLPDREYYLSPLPEMAAIRSAYSQHVEKMLELAKFPNAKADAGTIVGLETAIATIHVPKEENRDSKKLNNPIKVAELKNTMPNFNLKNYLIKAGMGKEKVLIVAQPEYMKRLDALIASTPLTTWKTYLKWSVLDGASSSLTKALDNQNFEFYGKVLNGTEKQRDDWKRAVQTVNGGLGEMIGKLYVEKHFSPEAKERMTVMVKNLLKAYAESIKSLDWMSEATKKEALKKVDKFMIKIGYPDKWRDYSSLTISKDDLYGNLQRCAAFEYDRNLAKLGKPVDRTEWGMTPQTVNAYYNPSLNEIVFPAAILQPPFFDMDADDAVNYGGIGAVIGHEIGHGFDDEGSTFDGDGKLRNWWNEADLAAFKKRTGALVAQYNAFEALPGLTVNGAYTLGENIGDLGGLSIAIKAYKMSLEGKEATKMDGFTGIQRVFLGWGQVWLDKSRPEAIRSQIAADPHSPAKFRINGVVRNIPEFYEAFNVKPGDSLYLAPEKRVKIW